MFTIKHFVSSRQTNQTVTQQTSNRVLWWTIFQSITARSHWPTVSLPLASVEILVTWDLWDPNPIATLYLTVCSLPVLHYILHRVPLGHILEEIYWCVRGTVPRSQMGLVISHCVSCALYTHYRCVFNIQYINTGKSTKSHGVTAYSFKKFFFFSTFAVWLAFLVHIQLLQNIFEY